LDLPLDTPLPRQCSMAVPLLEAIEQRATKAGVPVDSRIERGRNRRHALRQAIAQERFDRIVMAAASKGSDGFDAEDVAWLLDHAPGEIVVLRPSSEDQGPVIKPASARRPPRRAARPRALSREGEMAGSRGSRWCGPSAPPPIPGRAGCGGSRAASYGEPPRGSAP